ncbi:TMV resistance protein N isoform X2 [Neltuma alba]|uniref:TMV resistance protein N isoform X2 n=1 Tax=Neltuma alba TaxID=207710 RepID=UPI0010A48267|nr:TMV resistance protein N-like isoform X2 [Prosopis alba]
MDATIVLMLIEAVLILLAIAISKAIRLISPLHATHPISVDDSGKDVVDDPIPTVSSPSHIIDAPLATKYDVFLNFRGEDTHDNFTSYLYEALCDANIHTFMDHKLHKGDNISPILLETIEESEISLIIFSKDYASSTWCMDELVHIMKCRDKYKRDVIPIFYHVDPSNIRKQEGSFGDGFAKLKQRFKHNEEKVQEWKKALNQSTNLSGWDSKNFRTEPKLIKKIVKDILSKLNSKPSFHLEGLVGISHQIQKIEELLDEARIVGIWGMGGMGKTTLARAVFHKLKAQFNALSFVENVRKQQGIIGFDRLQQECLKELIKDEDINVFDIKSTFVRNRLRRKKILLILDDVDNSIPAEDLTKVYHWFGEGSRIILTSRDMQVLQNAFAFSIYSVPRLDFHDALHLFSLKAFKQNEPFKSYVELSKSVVDYCQGNPFALVKLGSFLQGRGKEEWESSLEKIEETPPNYIIDVLKLSFDGLDRDQKNMFLDIAFFIKEKVDVSLDLIGQLYGSSVDIDVNVLKDRSLTSFDHNGYIEMHNLVRDMGVEIARQQSFSNPKGSVRLRSHRDIYDFFICNKRTRRSEEKRIMIVRRR